VEEYHVLLKLDKLVGYFRKAYLRYPNIYSVLLEIRNDSTNFVKKSRSTLFSLFNSFVNTAYLK